LIDSRGKEGEREGRREGKKERGKEGEKEIITGKVATICWKREGREKTSNKQTKKKKKETPEKVVKNED